MMPSAPLIRLLILVASIETLYAVRIFNRGEIHPSGKDEISTCGNIRDVIRRNSARFRKILVRNTNAEIVFVNDDSRRMTARSKSKLDVLASRVSTRWSGKKLKVLKAWTDTVVSGTVSLHYEGRAVQLVVSDNDVGKLGELAGLAVQAGFDWITYTQKNYVHASVIRDVCQTSIDLAFILDTSGSVGSYNFEKVKTFVKNVIDFFNIGTTGTHVAVVTYSSWSVVEFNLKAYYSKTSLKNAVSGIYYRAGWTYTGDALETTRTDIFNKDYGMRPDKGVPKVAVLLTDGYSNGWGVTSAANALKKQGVNLFCIGVGNYNRRELNDIATDPDSTHVFTLDNFNDLSSWVDKLSSVSCDEGATVSSCDDTTSSVDGGSFLYFKTKFVSLTGGISVEVKDIEGISHLYVSLTSTNPGPMDPNSKKNELNTSPRSIRLDFKSSRSSTTIVYVAVQGQLNTNKFKLSMWDTLFSQDSYTVAPYEEVPGTQNVIRVVSSVTGYRLKYSITDGNSEGKFQINSQTGQITATRLDRETTAIYRITVLAKNIDNACHKGRTVVVVNVRDKNDNAPKFSQNLYHANVKENARIGTSVTTVTATDKDTTHRLTYRIMNNFNTFSIDSNGVVRTTKGLDFESQDSYLLEIRASDGNNEAKTHLKIRVLNVNERPSFNAVCARNNRCSFQIIESANVGTNIGQLNASDPDGDRLAYKLKMLDSQDTVFVIDASGRISLKKKLDREVKPVYSVLLTASDSGTPVLATQTIVSMVVADYNDNSPTFPYNKYTASVYENAARGSTVMQVVATDADIGTNSKLTYSIQGGDMSFFTIEPNTGVIKTSQAFDREAKSSYQLNIRVLDGGNPQLHGQTSVTVSILDFNDNPPQFTGTPYSFSVSEDSATGVIIYPVSATDRDIGINADLRYYIVSGNVDNTFVLESQTGRLKLANTLDYERRTSYRLIIGVSDRGLPSLSSTTNVQINVQDVNDNSPIFASSVYRATVKENSPVGRSVVKVLATDRDSGSNGEVEYTITHGNPDNTFRIDSGTGLIMIKKSPKFKTNSRYDLTVQARDKGQPIKTDTSLVKITIEDVNDNKPIFGQDKYSVQVSEDVSIGTTVQNVSAKDEDSGPRGRVLYSILSGNIGNKFTIDGSTGSIKVSSSLDRELTKVFTLTVEARDGGTPPLSSNCQVLINVIDVNDNTPVFNGPYTFHVSEDKPVGYLVGQVTAADRDSGENGRITYTGNTDIFNINSTSGQINLLKQVDHETKSSYSLTVTASDHGSPPRSTSIVVKVIVDDVNDNPPKFTKDMYNCSVAENMVKGATVCYVTAVDPDSNGNGRLLYSIAGGNGRFLINSYTGEITTTTPLDRESTASYRLTVTVRDGQTSRSDTSFNESVTVYVRVQDENDNPPRFTGAPYGMKVKEDAIVGTSVGNVSAVDADTGTNGVITYSILQGNTEQKFTIDPRSGAISVQKSLDREQTSQYTLTVQAKDSGTPVPQSTSTSVVVSVEDVNDHSPSFERDVFYGQIREDASIGSSVLQVKAVDRDEGSNAKLTFSLSGKGSENFTIDSTGFVKSFTALDYETTSSYLLTVTAKDSGNPPKQDTAKVNISIINVNDNVPTFDSTGQVTSIPEDVAIGTRVVKLNATDSDGSKLTFAIVKGNVGSSFRIGSDTGVISVAKRLDRENVANYTLVVKATDNGGMSVSNNATIRVLDVNDNKPTFEKGTYSVKILENKPAGTTVVKLHATDSDLGKNAEITYQISSGDKTKFVINPATGLITTLATLDREQQQVYQLYVTAKDHGTPSQSSVAVVTVTVEDVNDNRPRLAQSTYSVSVVENTALNSVILRLRAVDPDEGTNGQVSYAITSGNDARTFGINANTGELSVLKLIDREARALYSLKVTATDSGNPQPLNSSASISITITDENDNAPVFTNQNASFSVKENAPRDTLVGVVTATDADVGSNSQIVYSIVKGGQNVFAINSKTGNITVNGGIDRETMETYQLTIRASDRGSPVLFTDVQYNIRIDDVNDNAPIFEKSTYRVNIREDSPKKSSVVVVKATDADLGANADVRYQIVSGNTQSLFSINVSSGLISTANSLDYEKQPKYTLEVSATDSANTSKASVIIDVVDVNDNNPVFGQRVYLAKVQENKLMQFLSVSATDKDPFGGLVFSLNSSYPKSNRFNIDPTSGAISTAEPLDRETDDEYVIQVIVADGGTPARTDTAVVMINVTDVNDNRPAFNDSTYSVTVLENIAVNTIVTRIFASDRDLGNNAKLSYRMSQSKFFSIESDTGIIRNVLTLDRESTPSYTLTCTATDSGYPTLTSEPVTIHVTLQDVNDNAPRFENQPYRSNVSENEAVGSLVAEVFAVDRDLGDAGKVVYRITSGDQMGMFSIDNNTGIIALGRKPDREHQDFYTLTVQASDLGTPPMLSTTNVNISILDVNDNAPIFNSTSLKGSVKENEPSGTYVMRLSAKDADLGNNARIQFSFQTDEYKNLFSLNKDTGVIVTRKGLDRERQERYVLKIIASDMGNPRLTSSADVIIDVIDEDDNCPVFQYSEYNVTISEDIAPGAEIVPVLATDVDQENVTYYIRSGNPGGAFIIDRKTGMIKVANPDAVDRERHEAFKLIVRAGSENCGVNETDGGNTAEGGVDILSSAIATVNIILKDVNDNQPRFKESAYTFDFKDITTTFLFTISATDKDLGPGGIVKYKKTGQTEINGNHVATVAAYDQGKPRLESNVTVTVHVKSGLSCEAMVFNVTNGGEIFVKTLCHFEEIPDESKTVDAGDPHELKCSAKGNTVPQYRWMLDGTILTDYSTSGNYTIRRLSQEDEGSYSCLASSEAGTIQSSAGKLIVNEKPTVILHPKNTSAALGGTATLECKATGDPNPMYHWYKSNAPILATDGIIPDKPTLIIRETIIQDEAWYHCTLVNAAGTTKSRAAYLKIFRIEALVSLEISVGKPNLAKRCHIFELEAFKRTLNKVLEVEATITNMTVLTEILCESDPCYNNPCMNDGVCRNGPGINEFTCRCKPGWEGKYCTNDINECQRTRPCLNGTCTNSAGNYQCKCTSYSTGKNCNLRKDACAGKPCNNTETCVLSEMHATGYKCLSEDKLIEMKYTKEIAGDGDKFELEKTMREIIMSAPDNLIADNSSVNTNRRKRSASDKIDYGTCVARIHRVSDSWIKFFLLCPKDLNADQNAVKQYVCGLMLDEKVAESCGSGSNMMTPVPPVTYPPINPMRVKIMLFGRDKSNRDVDGERLIGRMQSKAFQQQMGSHGVEFVSAKQVRPKPLKAKTSSSNTGLIIGLTIVALMALAVVIVGYLYYQRRRKHNKQLNIEDRAILRRDSRHQNVHPDVSTRDITRSEKKYINQAFTDSVYDDDDEGEFMVEVNLSSPKTKKKVTPITKLNEEPWYYDKITSIEAEDFLDSKVQPGAFLVRKGLNPNEYVLTVRCPEGGPSHRHLVIKYTNKQKCEVQFGTMPLPLEFDAVGDVIDHFQVTPIEFGPNVPDVVLTEAWCKSQV